MTVGAHPSPARGMTGARTMTDSTKDKERGEKRGVLGTGRAQKLDKDASADADNDDSED